MKTPKKVYEKLGPYKYDSSEVKDIQEWVGKYQDKFMAIYCGQIDKETGLKNGIGIMVLSIGRTYIII